MIVNDNETSSCVNSSNSVQNVTNRYGKKQNRRNKQTTKNVLGNSVVIVGINAGGITSQI